MLLNLSYTINLYCTKIPGSQILHAAMIQQRHLPHRKQHKLLNDLQIREYDGNGVRLLVQFFKDHRGLNNKQIRPGQGQSYNNKAVTQNVTA